MDRHEPVVEKEKLKQALIFNAQYHQAVVQPDKLLLVSVALSNKVFCLQQLGSLGEKTHKRVRVGWIQEGDGWRCYIQLRSHEVCVHRIAKKAAQNLKRDRAKGDCGGFVLISTHFSLERGFRKSFGRVLQGSGSV